MSDKKKHFSDTSRMGRPVVGIAKKSTRVTLRLDPYTDKALETACEFFGMNKAEGIRQGITLFLQEAGKRFRRE